MKTKAKSVHVFEVRLWSKKHYHGTNYRVAKNVMNIYDGWITDSKTKKKKAIHSVGELLKAMEEMYREDEKNFRSNE